MTADYESELKKAWDAMHRNSGCGPYQSSPMCKGHAALLGMVDAYHIWNCPCARQPPRGSNPIPPRNMCVEERRRLRAAVGVNDGR